MATDNVQKFTDGDFEETVIKAGGPVLGDSGRNADRQTPGADGGRAGRRLPGIMIGKMNADENPNTAFRFRCAASGAVAQGGGVVSRSARSERRAQQHRQTSLTRKLVSWCGRRAAFTKTPAITRDVIITARPAGLTAALYTARANLAPLVVEGPRFAGG
jgi:hypothetical protein